MGLLTIINQPLYVDVDINVFKFVSGKYSYELETCMYLVDINAAPIKVVSIGQRKPPNIPAVQIELFKYGERVPRHTNRYFLLEFFMNYGMRVLQKEKPSIFRPAIIYKNIFRLDEVLLGYQQVILERAGMRGGARKVIFEESLTL